MACISLANMTHFSTADPNRPGQHIEELTAGDGGQSSDSMHNTCPVGSEVCDAHPCTVLAVDDADMDMGGDGGAFDLEEVAPEDYDMDGTAPEVPQVRAEGHMLSRVTNPPLCRPLSIVGFTADTCSAAWVRLASAWVGRDSTEGSRPDVGSMGTARPA